MTKIKYMFKTYAPIFCLITLVTILGITGARSSSADQVQGVKISNLTQNIISDGRVLKVDYTLENPTDDFLNDLKISASLFKAKADKVTGVSGSVLDNTEYVLTFSGQIAQVLPKASSKGSLDIPLPENLDTGEYFVSTQIQNEDGTIGLSWISETATKITGTGGYIYIPTASVLFKDINYRLLEGKAQDKKDGFSVGFVRGENPRFDALVDAGNLNAKIDIVALTYAGYKDGKNTIFSNQITLKKGKVGNNEYNVFTIPAITDIAAGSYDVHITLTAKNQNLTTDPIIARWLVDGFVGRIGEVVSGTNVLQKGMVDLKVDIHGQNGEGKPIELKAIFKNQAGVEVFNLAETITFATNNESLQVDFSDKKIELSQKEKIDTITLQLVSNGTILDAVDYTVKSEQDFVKVIKSNSLTLIYITIIALLIIILIIHKIVHKDTSTGTTALLAVLIMSAGLILISTGDVFAGRNTTPKQTDTYVIVEDKVADINGVSRLQDLSQGPSGNIGACPQTVTVAFAGWHACPHCANGINISMTLNARVFDSLTGANYNTTSYSPEVTVFPGGMSNNFGTPIFTHTLRLTNDAPKIEYSVKGVSTNWGHGFCLGSEKTSATQTITCTPNTPPENPTCDPATSPNCPDGPGGNPGQNPNPNPGNPGGGGGNCPVDQKYCPTSGNCIGVNQVCPAACGNPIVPAGGGLNTRTANMCAPGFVPVASSIFARPSTNKWYWTCAPADTPTSGSTSGQCEASCPEGTFYEGSKGYCATECPDWCPNIEGPQTSVREYIRDDNGHCLTDGVIKYFRAKPDTNAAACPAFWETAVGAAARMDCKINGQPVSANNLDIAGAVGRPVDSGRLHTLSCDVKLIEDNTLIKTVTASTRCFRPGGIIEN